MRSVGLSDLDQAARALMHLPPPEWDRLARRLIEQAHVADIWRKRHGVAHPDGGTGSLYAQASLLPRVATSRCTAQYCAALEAILRALASWRMRDHCKM
ncbi:MAG: DUF7742 family protein [Octadecabacter sp.]